MPTRLKNILRTRSLLHDPYPQSPHMHRILQQEIIEEQRIINILNNTGEPWATDEYQLNFNPNEDTYTIPNTNFGKALFVVKATGNANVPFIAVPFTDVRELDYGKVWLGIDSIYAGLYGPNTTPEKMAFHRVGGIDPDVKVTIQPMPKISATYTITYLIGNIGDEDPLGALTVMPEHHTLIQLRSAAALLPYSQWTEDEERDHRKKQELKEAFAYQLSMDEPIFNEYKKSLIHPRMVDTESWDE